MAVQAPLRQYKNAHVENILRDRIGTNKYFSVTPNFSESLKDLPILLDVECLSKE